MKDSSRISHLNTHNEHFNFLKCATAVCAASGITQICDWIIAGQIFVIT